LQRRSTEWPSTEIWMVDVGSKGSIPRRRHMGCDVWLRSFAYASAALFPTYGVHRLPLDEIVCQQARAALPLGQGRDGARRALYQGGAHRPCRDACGPGACQALAHTLTADRKDRAGIAVHGFCNGGIGVARATFPVVGAAQDTRVRPHPGRGNPAVDQPCHRAHPSRTRHHDLRRSWWGLLRNATTCLPAQRLPLGNSRMTDREVGVAGGPLRLRKA
jgi:hypothetical protein